MASRTSGGEAVVQIEGHEHLTVALDRRDAQIRHDRIGA